MNLIDKLKNNEEAALSVLIDKYAKNAYQLAYSILKNQYESEDIVQEVFVKLWNYRDKLNDDKELLPLIYLTAKRLSLNRLRNIYFKTKMVDINDTVMGSLGDFKDEYSVKEILKLEEEILSNLPEQQRKVYLLSRKEGKSYEEIAAELQISPNTVRNHIVQALKTIRSQFEKYGYLSFYIFFLLN